MGLPQVACLFFNLRFQRAVPFLEFLFRPLAIGDVPENVPSGNRLAADEVAVDTPFKDDYPPILGDEFRLYTVNCLTAHDPLKDNHAMVLALGGDHVEHREVRDLLITVAHSLFPGAVDVQEAAGRVYTLDEVVGVLEKVVIAGFTLLERILYPFELGDILETLYQVGASVQVSGGNGENDGDHLAVRL